MDFNEQKHCYNTFPMIYIKISVSSICCKIFTKDEHFLKSAILYFFFHNLNVGLSKSYLQMPNI